MNVLKFFVFLTFLTFLGGCASQPTHPPVHKTPCPVPGQPNLSGLTCTYKLKVKEVNHGTGEVKATVPKIVLDENIKSGKKHNVSRDYSKYPLETVYTFTVSDTTGLEVGKVFEFHRKPIDQERSYNNTLERGSARSDHLQ